MLEIIDRVGEKTKTKDYGYEDAKKTTSTSKGESVDARNVC